MGSCYAKKFVDICRSQWDYQCGLDKWNKYADDLDKVDYFTGCGAKQNLDFCAVGLCWAMWCAVIDPDCESDPEAAKWAAHYFMYQSDSCDTAAVVKYLYQFFADNGATTDNPERGDIVIFQKDGKGGTKIMYHCGAVTDWDWDNNKIEVTEFNTEGGKVKPHYYKFDDIGGKIKCFCRPRYDGWDISDNSDPEPIPEPMPEIKFDASICKYCKGMTMHVKTQTDPLNLRCGPGTKYPIIGSMPKGSHVTWFGEYSGEWYRVEYNGKIGFANSNYLGL